MKKKLFASISNFYRAREKCSFFFTMSYETIFVLATAVAFDVPPCMQSTRKMEEKNKCKNHRKLTQLHIFFFSQIKIKLFPLNSAIKALEFRWASSRLGFWHFHNCQQTIVSDVSPQQRHVFRGDSVKVEKSGRKRWAWTGRRCGVKSSNTEWHARPRSVVMETPKNI